MSAFSDKTVKVADGIVNTSKAIYRSTGTAVRSSSRTTGNILVERTPDYYDQHDDFSRGATKVIVGNSMMAGRSQLRLKRSTQNVYHKIRRRKTQRKIAEIQERNKDKNLKDISAEDKRLLAKNKQVGEKHLSKIDKSSSFSFKKSAIATTRNQTRKLLNSISQKDDISSKIIGKGMKGAFTAFRYRQKAYKTAKTVITTIKGAIGALISFVASIPGLIATIISVLPILIVLVIIITVMSFFTDLEYNGRISNFVDNETRLEKLYHTNVAPDEILAITQTLGWTTQTEEEYRMLFAVMFDGQKGANTSSQKDYNFETMMDNVFRKYNPAIYFSNHLMTSNDTTGSISYYTYNWLGFEQSKQLTFNNFMKIYPLYNSGTEDFKNNYGNENYIEELKEKCRENLASNGDNYVGSFFMYGGYEQDPIFTEYPMEIMYSATYKIGYRSNPEVAFHAGIDLGTGGTNPDVFAPCKATVIYTSDGYTLNGDEGGTGYGNQVILAVDLYDRNGNPLTLYIRYAHLYPGTVCVEVNDIVEPGQKLGQIGNTGYSFGTHLHWEGWVQRGYDGSYSNKNYLDKTTSIDDDKFFIYVDLLMFYDVNYRNKAYGR